MYDISRLRVNSVVLVLVSQVALYLEVPLQNVLFLVSIRLGYIPSPLQLSNLHYVKNNSYCTKVVRK